MTAAAPASLEADRLVPRPAEGYAGDVTPELACAWWQAGEAVLVDVRSDAEREWVGFVPGTSVKDGIARFVAWYREYYQV